MEEIIGAAKIAGYLSLTTIIGHKFKVTNDWLANILTYQ